MSEASLAHAPARNTPLDVLAERVEEELDRLRRHRPILDGRIDRAARIVVVQLSSPPAARPIKCRIRRGGKRVLLVASLSSGGAVYQVNPDSWTCSCPDYSRKGTGCKHAISGWALWRASLPREVEEHLDRLEEINERIHDDDDAEEDGLTYAQVEEWLRDQRWQVAKTMPDNPHSYALKRNAADPAMFDAVVRFIQERGDIYRWWGADYRQLVANRHAHWSMSAPGQAILINRKDLEQVRKDELRNRGGGGLQWRWLHGPDIEADRAALRAEENGQDELGEEA